MKQVCEQYTAQFLYFMCIGLKSKIGFNSRLAFPQFVWVSRKVNLNLLKFKGT